MTELFEQTFSSAVHLLHHIMFPTNWWFKKQFSPFQKANFLEKRHILHSLLIFFPPFSWFINFCHFLILLRFVASLFAPFPSDEHFLPLLLKFVYFPWFAIRERNKSRSKAGNLQKTNKENCSSDPEDPV
jgi:hypothetical protein